MIANPKRARKLGYRLCADELVAIGFNPIDGELMDTVGVQKHAGNAKGLMMVKIVNS